MLDRSTSGRNEDGEHGSPEGEIRPARIGRGARCAHASGRRKLNLAGPIALGYQLHRVLGRVPWAKSSQHPALVDGEIAVKVALPQDASDPWADRALDNEVTTAAQLDHPGIVGVFDHGRVELVAHTASDGRLPVGAPYVVMDMLKGRSLHEFIGRLSWFEVQEVLRQLLDALGHCHARGVIHRDLKPGNVVLEADRSDPDGALRLSLMDFGLARFFGQPAPPEETVAGTPAYMAPEQLQGSWRAQGPWTDLYSVGCLGWTLITGTPPFGRRRSYEAFREDHLHRRPPPLDPMIGVPVAVEEWLLQLLAKSPVDRFRSAADARNALDMLPSGLQADALTFEPVAPPVRVEHGEPDAGDELSLGRLLSTANLGKVGAAALVLDDDTRSDVFEPLEEAPEVWAGAAPPSRALFMPVPEQWTPFDARASHPLVGSGLGVFGHRKPRLMGRIDERNHLWHVLRQVEASGQPQVVVLRGAPGTGKAVRGVAVEQPTSVGVESLRANFTETEAADAGFVAMFRRALRLDGLQAEQVETQIRQALLSNALEALELQALVDALAPAAAGAQDPVRFSEPRERRVLFSRLCAWLTRCSARVDGQGGRPGIVCSMMRTTPRSPGVCRARACQSWARAVVCGVDHLRCDRGRRHGHPTRSLGARRGEYPTGGTLETADHRALIDSLLRFEGARRHADCANGGNPRFAACRCRLGRSGRSPGQRRICCIERGPG